MADFSPIGVVATVEGLNEFNRDIGKMNSKVGSVETSANKVGSSFSGMGSKAAGAAATIGGAFVAATAAAVAGIGLLAVGIGKVSFDFALESDKAMKDLQTQLGLTAKEAEAMGQVVEDVYANNFGDSLGDVSAAIIDVNQQLKSLDPGQIQAATENAFRFSDAFGTGMDESLNSVNALMTEFGLTQGEAFDLMTAGMQGGLNSSDDFLDSIGEYSNLFADAGFSADQMYSIFETGAASGVLGTDKIADSVKEFGNIMNEGGADVEEVFATMGLDFGAISRSVAAGDEAWGDYFSEIVGGINNIEDPIERARVQTELFGTMAGDLGVSFTDGLSASGTALDEFSGKTAALDAQYDTLGQRFEGLKRQVLVALAPIGEKLLELAEGVFPVLEEAVAQLVPVIQNLTDWLAENLPLALETAANFWTTTLSPALKEFGTFVSETVIPALQDLAVGFRKQVMPAITSLMAVIRANLPKMQAIFLTVFKVASKSLKAFMIVMNKSVLPPLRNAIQSLTSFIEGFGLTWSDVWVALGNAALIVGAVIGAAILGIIGVFTGLLTAWANVQENITASWLSIQKAATDFRDALTTVIVELVNAVTKLFEGDFSGAFESLKTAYWGAQKMTDAFSDAVFAAIKGTFGSIIAFLGGFVEGFLGFFVTLADQLTGDDGIITGMLGMIYDVISGVGWVEALSLVMVAIVAEMIKQTQAVVDAFVIGFDALIAAIIKIGGEWEDQIVTIMGLIKDAIIAGSKKWVTAMSNKLTAIKDKIIAGGELWLQSVKDKLTAIKDAIVATAQEWVDAIDPRLIEIKDKIVASAAEWLTAVSDKVIEIKDKIIEVGGEWLTAITTAGANILAVVIQNWLDNFNAIQEKATEIKDGIVSWGAEWLTAITTVGADILAVVIQNWLDNFNAIQTKATEIKDGIVSWGAEWLAAITTAGANILASLIQNWLDNFNAIQTKITEIGTLISNKATEWITTITSSSGGWLTAGIGLVQNLISGILRKIPEVISAVTGLIADAIEAVTKYEGSWLDMGADMMAGLLEGLKSGKDAVMDWISDLASDFVQKVKDKFKMRSPSRVMYDIGQDIIKGLTEGMKAGTDEAINTVFSMSKKILSLASNLAERTGNVGASAEIEKNKENLDTLEQQRKFLDLIIEKGFSLEGQDFEFGAVGGEGLAQLEAHMLELTTIAAQRETALAAFEVRRKGELLQLGVFGDIETGGAASLDAVARISEIPEEAQQGFSSLLEELNEVNASIEEFAGAQTLDPFLITNALRIREEILAQITQQEMATTAAMRVQAEIAAELAEAQAEIAAAEERKKQALKTEVDRIAFLGKQKKLLQDIESFGFEKDFIFGGAGGSFAGTDLLDMTESEFLEVLTRFNREVAKVKASELLDFESQILHATELAAIEADLLAIEQERAALAAQQAALSAEQGRLKFLQDQQKLLADIALFEFDQGAILQGFQVGVEADMGQFLEVMTRFTSAMIGQVEEDLDIASPSKVFMKIGQQTMQGLTQGIMSMSAVPGQVMSAATNMMTQRASAPNVNTAQNNTFNTTISSQMDAAQFQAMLNRSLSNAIV